MSMYKYVYHKQASACFYIACSYFRFHCLYLKNEQKCNFIMTKQAGNKASLHKSMEGNLPSLKQSSPPLLTSRYFMCMMYIHHFM